MWDLHYLVAIPLTVKLPLLNAQEILFTYLGRDI